MSAKSFGCVDPHRHQCKHHCTDVCWATETIRVYGLRLLMLAERQGQIVTIEQRPLLPLAMGNYESVVSVRPARGKG